MRRISLVAGIILLTNCGSPPTEDTSTDNMPGTQGAEDYAAGNTDMGPVANVSAPVANAARPVTEVQDGAVSPCLVQGAERLRIEPFRAVGTEPFWAARVEGRCVTYSNPENQKGTRVWTRYSQGADGRGAWVGQLGGQKFDLRTRSEANCSDGMSDKRYPIAVELMVNGERRVGCAEPL